MFVALLAAGSRSSLNRVECQYGWEQQSDIECYRYGGYKEQDCGLRALLHVPSPVCAECRVLCAVLSMVLCGSTLLQAAGYQYI